MNRQNQPQTIRRRIQNWLLPRLFPSHMQEVDRMVGVFEDAYRRGGLLMPPQAIINQLKENGQLLDLILRMRGATALTGLGAANQILYNQQDRVRAIRESRYMAFSDVNIERAVSLWTDFGLGKRVQVSSAEGDPTVDAELIAFFTNPANLPIIGQDNIQEISKDSLNEGELAGVFWYSPLDGTATIRTIPTDQLTVIWEDENTKKVPVLFLHATNTGNWYYRDWRATDQAVEKVSNILPTDGGVRRTWLQAGDNVLNINGQEVAATQAIMLWKVRNRINGRGVPQFYNGLPWADELNQFIGARSAVAQQAAAYAEKVIVKGGSRPVSAVQNSLQSSLATSNEWLERNPAPAPGSTWIENENITREWMNRDTGGSSAEKDGNLIAGQQSVNTGIPLHWMGFPGMIPGGRATAREMLLPWIVQIGGYKLWLTSFFEDMGQIVLKLREDYGQVVFADKALKVSLDAPVLIEQEFLLALMGQVVTAAEKSVLDFQAAMPIMEELMIMALTVLGVRDPQAMFETVDTEGTTAETFTQVINNVVKGKIKPETAVTFLMQEFNELSHTAANGNGGRNGHVKAKGR